MQIKFWIPIALICGISFLSCRHNATSSEDKGAIKDTTTHISLNEQQAAHIFSLPNHCIMVEYPNKLGQVLGSDTDLKSPKQLRPIFYGCFDWHSAVHGYWSIVELMQKYPALDSIGSVRATLNQHITADKVATELAFFNDPNNKNFERTYGWAWLFKLQESLAKWNDTDAQKWKANLQPLVDLLVKRYQEYLPKLVFPLREGMHNNSAFGLSLSLDYARSVKDTSFENSIVEHSKRLFQNDKGCTLSYEPNGYDFLSPCLEEAYLMSKVLSAGAYESWLKDFLPQLFEKDFDLQPTIVKDRSDGHLVHLDGLNYSRAACLYGISKAIPELSHLKKIANAHIAFSLPNLSAKDDYMGSHWLGTFALYAIAHAQ